MRAKQTRLSKRAMARHRAPPSPWGVVECLGRMGARTASGLHSQLVEIKYRKPTPRGVKISGALRERLPLGSHAQIFFPGAKPLITFPEIKEFKRSSGLATGATRVSSTTWLVVARSSRAAARISRRIIFRPLSSLSGRGQKFTNLVSMTAWQARASRTFFFAESPCRLVRRRARQPWAGSPSKKRREIQGGGGGHGTAD